MGKGKKPKIDAVALGVERGLVQQQLTTEERAALVEISPDTADVMFGTCTEFVPRSDFDLAHCARCGKVERDHVAATAPTKTYPLSVLDELADEARQSENRIGSTFDSFLEANGIKEEVEALTAAKIAATDDGPLHEPAAFQGMVEIPEPWFSRAVTMAQSAGVGVPEFIESLIKRQWIASGAGRMSRR